jgi:hypothetical protein
MKISELKSPYKELAELRKDSSQELIGYFSWSDTPEGHYFWRDVDNGKYPPIPAESLKELGEWVIGGEYEFSDGDGNWEIGKEYEFTHESMRGWGKRELVAILPKEYKDRYIVSSRSIKKGWTYMSDIRYIEP